jgi:hypothetical protein
MNKKLAAITLFCLTVFTASGQIILSEKAQTLLNNPSLPEEKRLDSLYTLLDASGHYGEAIPILRHQLYPFVAKIKNKPLRDRMYTRYYSALTTCYNKTGDTETACTVADSILIYTERIDDTHWEKAEGFFTCGILQHTAGNQVSQGQDYIAKALQIYESLDGYEERQSNCLYHLAIPYLAANDHEGMEKIVNRLEALARKINSKDVWFQLYSLKQAYYGDLSTRNPEQESLLDSSVVYSKKTIDLIERYYDELSTVHLPFYNYYNLAVLYLENYGHQTDSARYYLEKAEKWIHIPANAADATIYMDIVTANVYAWAFFYDERYPEAENRMLEALELMQQVDNNFIIPELSDTYGFFVQLYEKTHRPALALKYQKLLTENELKRLDSEKAQALNEIETQYETEKKENQILELQNEKSRYLRIILLITGFLVIFLITGISVVVNLRLRHKNREQKQYESALLSEQLQMEKEERMEQNTVQWAVEKITGIIETSVIVPAKKEQYFATLKGKHFGILENTIASCTGKITAMDLKYTVCFAIDMDVKDIALMFNIEPASVYTVRYRIRRKYKTEI